MARREGIRDKDLINSEQELVATFISESVGIYVQQMSSEGFPGVKKRDLIDGTKESIEALLDGLPDYTEKLDQERVKMLLSAIRENLDSYIKEVDKELTKDRDVYLSKNPGTEPNEAMAHISHTSKFGKIAEQLRGKNITIEDTGWKQLADFFKALGMPKLANFFEKWNEESKVTNQAKAMTQTLKTFGVKFESPGKQSETAVTRLSTIKNEQRQK